ncbi:MAG: aquaporin [Candidatus Nanopelagicaceae bacterium]
MRRYFSEFLGTGLIALAVVGSGYMAASLSEDLLLQLLVNALATIFILGLSISLLAPIGGAHFNPVVTGTLALMNQFPKRDVLPYWIAQIIGGVSGTILANLMFTSSPIEISEKSRGSSLIFLGEIVATAILLLLILLLIKQGRTSVIPIAVSAWIGGAYFVTVSTSFANPAITIARTFTNNFTGIAPSSVALFIVAQIVGAALAALLVNGLVKNERN